MDPLVVSQNLGVKITTPLDVDFIIDEITMVEAISTLYEMVVHVHTTDIEIAFDDLLGETIAVVMTYSGEDGTLGDTARVFTGIVGKIHQRQTFVDREADGSTVAYYTFYVYPDLWKTQLNQDCRIFQEKSVQDITETLFGEYGIENATIDINALPAPQHRYCIQYNESVFQFLSRLWEEEGIGYFFTHTEDGAPITLCNDTPSHAENIEPAVIPLQHYEKSTLILNTIQNMTYEVSVKQNEFDTVDYDYTKPSTSLSVVLPASEQKGGRVFEYPGRYQSLTQGEKLAQQRMEELEWDAAMVTGQSTVLAFSPYGAFTLDHHPRDEWNRRYILYKVIHRLRFHDPQSQNQLLYDNTFWAFPDDIPFRPKRLTPKPRIHSHQTALVVGPEGEEIYTDNQGRIRIQFPWDMYGENNDASSLWVRVAQTWSGPGWGALVVPRIGMEVVVSFINGDPDRPLVVGCVYNGDNPAPDEVQSPTKSIWRTQSSPSAEGFNEMSFEDSAGGEEIFFHAQKDWRTVIQNSREELIVDSDDTLTLTNGNRYASFYGEGINENIFVKDGCHKYNIVAGDYTIILGTDAAAEAAAAAAAGAGDESSSDPEAAAASSAAAKAKAATKKDAQKKAEADAAAAATAAADAAQRAAKGTGSNAEAIRLATEAKEKADEAAQAKDEADQAQQEADDADAQESAIKLAAKLKIAKDILQTMKAAHRATREAATKVQEADQAIHNAQEAIEARQEAESHLSSSQKGHQEADHSFLVMEVASQASKSKLAAKRAENAAEETDHSFLVMEVASQASKSKLAAKQAENAAKEAAEDMAAALVAQKEAQVKAQKAAADDPGNAGIASFKTAVEAAIQSVNQANSDAACAYQCCQMVYQNISDHQNDNINDSMTKTLSASSLSMKSSQQAVQDSVKARKLASELVIKLESVGSSGSKNRQNEDEDQDDDSSETSDEDQSEDASSEENAEEEADQDQAGGSSGKVQIDGEEESEAEEGGAGAGAGASDDEEEDAEGKTASGETDTPDEEGEANVGGNYTLFIENGDRTITLQKGDSTTLLSKGDYSITLTDGDDTLTITKGDYTITLASGDLSINVTGDISVTASGDISFDAGGDIDITASGDISMTATSIDMMAKLTIDGMAGLAVSWMAGLAVDGMAGLAHTGMALLLNENMALLKAETKGAAMAKVSGAMCMVNTP